MVDAQTVHERQVMDNLRRVFASNGQVTVFDTQIKKAVAVQESAVAGESMLTYDPSHPVAEAYRSLAQEMQ